MLSAGYFGAYHLALLTPRPLALHVGGPAEEQTRVERSLVVGRDCDLQVGLRVRILDPVQDLDDCSPAPGAEWGLGLRA
jgi:hypothetical protein